MTPKIFKLSILNHGFNCSDVTSNARLECCGNFQFKKKISTNIELTMKIFNLTWLVWKIVHSFIRRMTSITHGSGKIFDLDFCLKNFIETKFMYDNDSKKLRWYIIDFFTKKIHPLSTVMERERWVLNRMRFFLVPRRSCCYMSSRNVKESGVG